MSVAHTAVPYLYPEPSDRRCRPLAEMIRRAFSEPLEALVLGSSLHAISGFGNVYAPAINRTSAEFFGGHPGTYWMPISSHGTTPRGAFCASASRNINNATVTGLDTTYHPPDFTPILVNNSGGGAGHVLQFEPANERCNISEFGGSGEFFRVGSNYNYKFEWIGWSSGVASSLTARDTTMFWRLGKQASDGSPTFSGTVVNTVSSVNIPTPVCPDGTTFNPANATTHQACKLHVTASATITNISAAAAAVVTTAAHGMVTGQTVTISGTNSTPVIDGTHVITVLSTTTFSVPVTTSGTGNAGTMTAVGPTIQAHDSAIPNFCWSINGTSATGFIAVATRVSTVTGAKGLRFNFAGAGGYNSASLLANHANCGLTLKAMGPFHFVFINYHTNSAYSAGHSPATFKTNTQANINFVRGLFPEAMIILKADGLRVQGAGADDTDFSEMVGAMKELADENTNVFVINTFLATQRSGFNDAANEETGLTFIGAWATATAYVAGDVVSLDAGGQVQYARCIANHTSSATDKPFDTANAITNWRRWRRWLTPNPDPAASPFAAVLGDSVHLSAWGATRTAEIDFGILTSALNVVPEQTRVIQRGKPR